MDPRTVFLSIVAGVAGTPPGQVAAPCASSVERESCVRVIIEFAGLPSDTGETRLHALARIAPRSTGAQAIAGTNFFTACLPPSDLARVKASKEIKLVQKDEPQQTLAR